MRTGEATVAVLPFAAAWWPALTEAAPRLHIIARLPYWADRPPHVPDADALVVGGTAPDASGDDRCLIAADHSALADAGLTPRARHGAVAELPFMVAEDDPRLPPGAIVLGGYAVPVAGDFA